MSEKPERREGIEVSFRVTRRALGVVALCALMLAIVLVPIIIRQQAMAREGSTLANMHTIQLAAEDYGVQYDGQYSRTAAGLVPVLPRAGKLRNPFTNKWSEPRQGPAPSQAPPGSVWYTATAESAGFYEYKIIGFGKHGQLQLVLTSGR